MAAITVDELLNETEIHPGKLNECISDDHLHAVALFLTSWRKVAAYLELSESDMDAIEREERDDQMKKLKVLQKWKGKFGFKATYKKLVEVLLSLGRADVAEQVCRLLKGMYIIMSYISSCTLYNNFLHHKYTDIEHACTCML